MLVKISPSRIEGTIEAPPSKSYAHRLLIAAYLSGERVSVLCKDPSEDVFATAGALRSMGAEVSFSDNTITLKRCALPAGRVSVDCGESGSTLRFLLPVACALGIKADFTGRGRLLNRPVDALTEVLNAHGGKVSGLSVSGKLTPGVYEIDASLSSQYVSGLLFALCMLDGESEIVIKGERVSAPYIDMTVEVLKRFGASVAVTANGFEVRPGLCCKEEFFIPEGDWSNAAFALTAGALCGNVTVTGLNAASCQGDRRILEVLEMLGAKVTADKTAVNVQRGELRPVSVDITDIPDLAQIIAVAAAFAPGTSVIKNAARLKIKESDRISAIISTLGAAGISAQYSGSDIIIHGGAPHGGEFSGGKDHRTVMSAAVLAAAARGDSVISGAEAVNKSYPAFFKDLVKLGGKADVRI